MNFFFDENYGHKLAAGLDAFDEENSIKHFKDVGFLSTEDVEWFSRLPENERNVIGLRHLHRTQRAPCP